MLKPVFRASVWAIVGASLVVAGCAKKASKEDCAKWTSHAIEVMTKEWNSDVDSSCKADESKQAAKDVFEQQKKLFADGVDPMCSEGPVTATQVECFLKTDSFKAIDDCKLDGASSFAPISDSFKKEVKLLCGNFDDQAAAAPSAAASGAPEPAPTASAASSASATSSGK